MRYDEPSPFYYPIAATLGKLHVLEGAFATAAEVFREALFTFPRSFGLVMGLEYALRRAGRGEEVTVATLVAEVTRYNDTAFNFDFL